MISALSLEMHFHQLTGNNCSYALFAWTALQTRAMKPRPRLAGIWMVSKAREDGLKGKVTGKMCLASMSSCGESFLSRNRN